MCLLFQDSLLRQHPEERHKYDTLVLMTLGLKWLPDVSTAKADRESIHRIRAEIPVPDGLCSCQTVCGRADKLRHNRAIIIRLIIIISILPWGVWGNEGKATNSMKPLLLLGVPNSQARDAARAVGECLIRCRLHRF